jgi:hypothetical protein
MKDFVDLIGASGSSYRYRLLPKGLTPLRMAGNFAVLKAKAEGFVVAYVGVTTDLSQVREETPPLPGRGPFHTYIRLNVARGTREAEHADLVESYGPKTAALAAE